MKNGLEPQSMLSGKGLVYIETYGCQMNRADSEVVMSLLEETGYRRAPGPEDADVILVNTCAVREHASEKAITNISRLKKYKATNPQVRIGLIGCLSTHLGDQLAGRLPFLDWILGPDVYRTLPGLFNEAPSGKPVTILRDKEKELYDNILPSRRESVNAWVTISRGCSNFCTYCVVPGTRGPVRHRPMDSILKEVRTAVAEGFAQVTLLGQNVNSWSYDSMAFPDLLEEVASMDGIKRVRFITSHPKDTEKRLFEVLAQGLPLCPELHLPMQAGSNRILKRMNRKYTREQYLELVHQAKEILPDCLLSTDIIVGFPGETDEDYRDTVDVVKQVQYDEAFVYKYSERYGTSAANLEDSVPENVKIQRLMEVNQMIRESGLKKRKSLLGSKHSILFEGPSARDDKESMGRTPAGHVVVVPEEIHAGMICDVQIEELSGFTLRGKTLQMYAEE